MTIKDTLLEAPTQIEAAAAVCDDGGVIAEVVADNGTAAERLCTMWRGLDSHLHRRTGSSPPVIDRPRDGTRRNLCQSTSHSGIATTCT
jgi:hypothetical protein